MSEKFEFPLSSKPIIERYIKEEVRDTRQLSDGETLVGKVGDEYEAILIVVLGSPFFAAIATGLIIMINEFFSFLPMLEYEVVGSLNLAWVLYFIVWIVIAHILLKGLIQKIAQKNAYLYFDEGVSAAYRQLYLAKTRLDEEEYKLIIERRMAEERRTDVLIAAVNRE